MLKNPGWAVKKWLKIFLLSFWLARIGQNHLSQWYARGKLVGVEEEKSYKLKVWHRFQIQNISTFKDGRLTSNLELLGPKLFVCKGFLVLFLYYKKKDFNSKKISKQIFFHKKNLTTERQIEKWYEAKKMYKGHISGRQNISIRKTQNWRCGIHFEKFVKSNFRDPKKFFSFNWIDDRWLYPSLTKFLYTLVYIYSYIQLDILPNSDF